jgi:hypothetical protein
MILECKINEKMLNDVRRVKRAGQENVVSTWDYGNWPTRKELYDRRSVLLHILYENAIDTHARTCTWYLHLQLWGTAFFSSRLRAIDKVRSKLNIKQK